MILGLVFIFISRGDWGAGEGWAKVSTATLSTETKGRSEEDKTLPPSTTRAGKQALSHVC